MNRRDFLKVIGLTSGASVVSSCLDRKTEKIIPYLVPPDDGTIPGVAAYTHTSSMETGSGIAAKVMDYRVGKLEGIAGHPLNDGALSGQDQASLSTLYHPDRLTQPLYRADGGDFKHVSWDTALDIAVKQLKDTGGKNVMLSRRTTGSLSALVDRFAQQTDVEVLPEFEVFPESATRDANRIVFGRSEIPDYRIDRADFMLTIGADLFETFGNTAANGRRFAKAKKSGHFSWYHVEPHVSLSGLKAEHRYVITPGAEVYLLAFLARRIARANVAGDRHIAGVIEALPNMSDRAFAEKTGLSASALEEIANHLTKARHPLIIAGGVSTAQDSGLAVAVLTAVLQWATGATNDTVNFTSATDYSRVGSLNDIDALAQRLRRKPIGVMIFGDTDPLGAPTAAAKLTEPLELARFRIGLGQFMTATMEACDLVLPLSDNLESWGDAVPRRGVTNVIQPVVEPAHDTMAMGDALLEIMRQFRGAASGQSYQEYVSARWRSQFSGAQMQALLDTGFVVQNASRVNVSMDKNATTAFIRRVRLNDAVSGNVLYLMRSLRAMDGRLRNVPLLMEVPDPLTTVTYGDWVSVSEEMAEELGIHDKEEVRVTVGGWSHVLPAVIQPGLPRGVTMLQYNADNAMPSAAVADTGEISARFDGAVVEKTGKVIALPVLSGSKSQEGRGVIPSDHDEHAGHHNYRGDETMYPDVKYPDYRWAMAIDLDLCTGCSACAVACYVENNLAVTGPELHLQGREMSWIRIEPFYDHGEADFQPMMCQHCGDAPCETVCPVYATYHNPEGLNAQVYNRCVGTRYCLNNCPYKVRRFNWFDFRRPSELNLTRNPQVSVRGRGVMEKCTFCVQRIRAARDVAKDEDRKIQDGEVTPACAQTCPTNAIVFGNLQDESSEVRRWADSDRSYRVFEQLGTSSAVHYLKNKWKKNHA